jgi:hypothetical protein
VLPSLFLAFSLAPCFTSSSTQSSTPAEAAKCSGELWSDVSAFASAPAPPRSRACACVRE